MRSHYLHGAVVITVTALHETWWNRDTSSERNKIIDYSDSEDYTKMRDRFKPSLTFPGELIRNFLSNFFIN